MARTKQTMRPMTEEEKKAARLRSEEVKRTKQSSAEKGVLPVSKGGKSKMKAKSHLLRQQKLFKELRNAQAAVDLAIPRAPLMRVVREIALNVRGEFRWQSGAILCLHEALEDFMVDFLNDSNICAAHARRVTLMDKDMVVVSRVRYRFDPILRPLPMRDLKALKILSIPPALKRKRSTEVKVEDISENVPGTSKYTRLQTERERKERDSQIEKKKEKDIEFQSQEDDMQNETFLLEKENDSRVDKIPGQLICNVSSTAEEDYLHIAPEDIYMLRSKKREISDSVVYMCLRVLLKELPPNQAEEIFICDPLISLQLVNLSIKSKDILHYFEHIKSTSQFVVLPFVENSHWSLSIINLQKRTAILMNSLPGIHGQVKLATKRLILALGAKYSEWRGDEEFRLLNQPVPTQQDATSCGWHVIANAWKYILCKYKNCDINEFGTTETYVWSVRAQAIKKILDNAITPDDPDSPPPELTEITKKKGMPKVSPVKHFAFKQKEKGKEKEKGSPGKSKGPKIMFVSKTKGVEKRKEDEKVEKKQKDV